MQWDALSLSRDVVRREDKPMGGVKWYAAPRLTSDGVMIDSIDASIPDPNGTTRTPSASRA